MTNKYVKEAKRLVLERCESAGCRVYLFGSRARGDEDRWSDVDIGIDADGPLPGLLISDLCEILEESSIPYQADVVDMQTCQEKLRENILKEGILWKK